MPRGNRKTRENWTAEEIIADVIKWADQQQLANVATALRNALALLREKRRK